MQATVNPLRKPKPRREQCILHGRFYFTDEQGKLVSTVGAHVCLTVDHLWITPELSIPLGQIESMEIVEKRGVPPRRFIRIGYVNPITGALEGVSLCKPDPIGIGLYRTRPLQELLRRLEDLRRQPGTLASIPSASKGQAVPTEAPSLDRCEVCGAQPAYYVPYLFQVSAVLLSYRSDAKRRIHRRKHNAIHGLAFYSLTALTGWIGIGILAYPLVVFAAARNLTPSLGRASYVLGVLPSLGVAVLIVNWLL